MKLWKKCLMVGLLIAAVNIHGRPPGPSQEAGIDLTSLSIRLGRAEGKSPLSVVFTTVGGGARLFGNGELRPSASRPGFYEAGYAIFDDNDGTPRRIEAGVIYVAIPAADSDSDTVPDTADLSAAVDVSLDGEAVPNAASADRRVTQPGFSLRLVRAADSETGYFDTDLIPTESLGGDYSVLHAEGTLAYRRTDAGALLDFDLSNAVTNATGVARVVDSNTVRVSSFRFRASPSRRVRVVPATLIRSGNVYRDEVTVSDGLTETAAADFRTWVLQVRDENDSDANGVPNLSDILPPFIAVQPRRAITDVGETVSFSVVVSGPGPFTFEWHQNGHALSNTGADATARVLVIPNVTLDDRGSYRVRVSNAAGSIFSDSTSLSFK